MDPPYPLAAGRAFELFGEAADGAAEVPERGGAGPRRPAPAFLVGRGCSSAPRGISGGALPPRPTPTKKHRPAAATHPRTTVLPSAAPDARSSASSPDLYYDEDFFSTQMLEPMESGSQPLMTLLTQDSEADLMLLSGGKGPSKRGSNYTHQEDIQLCISWMNVSNDPVVANEQPSKAYYQRIADDYHKNKDFESNRSTKSLEQRISGIIKDCMKFQSYYEEIERRHPSGVPYQEHMMEAQARYAKASNGKTCQLIHCWLKVRHSEKFAAARMNVGGSRPAKSRDINLNVPAGSQQAGGEGQEVGQGQEQPIAPVKTARPPGRKKSKEKMKRCEGEDEYMGMMKSFFEIKSQEHAMKKEMWAKEMEADEEAKKKKEMEDSRRLQLEERKVEIEQRRLLWEQEKEIMFCDLTTMDEHQRAYVRAKRAELAKAALISANVGDSASCGESFVSP